MAINIVMIIRGKAAMAIKRLFVLTLLIALLVPVAPLRANSQTPAPGSESLTVSPPTVELNATPGQALKQKITLDNGANSPRTIKVVAQNFGAAGESGSPELTDDQGPYSLASWIKVSPETATIGPKESKEFEVSINIPANPPPGGRFGALVFEPTANPGSPEEQVKVVSRVSSLLLLRLPGEIEENLSNVGFIASEKNAKTDKEGVPLKKTFFQSGPVTFHNRVKNDGNIQVKPDVEVTVYNIFGAKIGTVKPTAAGNVLPASTRRFESEWKHNTLFGYYKAKATVTYGTSEKKTITTTTSFWGANYTFLGGILVALIAFFVLVWLPRKRWRKAIKALAAGD